MNVSLLSARALPAGLFAALVAGSIGLASPAAAADAAPVVGSWRPEVYTLASGAELPVDGRIIFLAGDGDGDSGEWTVVFFVTDDAGNPLRGSAEGGAWSRDDASLLLTHQVHLSAGEAVGPLPASPLSMELRPAEVAERDHREPCTFEVSGDRLTLFFPSGNSMRFVRVEGLRPG